MYVHVCTNILYMSLMSCSCLSGLIELRGQTSRRMGRQEGSAALLTTPTGGAKIVRDQTPLGGRRDLDVRIPTHTQLRNFGHCSHNSDQKGASSYGKAPPWSESHFEGAGHIGGGVSARPRCGRSRCCHASSFSSLRAQKRRGRSRGSDNWGKWGWRSAATQPSRAGPRSPAMAGTEPSRPACCVRPRHLRPKAVREELHGATELSEKR